MGIWTIEVVEGKAQGAPKLLKAEIGRFSPLGMTQNGSYYYRRSFDIGILYEHHRGLAHRLGRVLRDEGLSVRYNRPYSGMNGMMYTADRHGSHHRLPCLEIEVNQGLFDRRGVVPRLGRAVARGARALLETTA